MRTDKLERDLAPHDHVVAVYGDPDELVGHVRSFLDEGVRLDHLSTLVHHDGSEGAGRLARAARPDAERLVADERLVLTSDRETFEEDGALSIERAARSVGDLRDRAGRQGRRGVRIFVDASRRYLASGRADEWFAFEGQLGRRLAADVALVCAYDRGTILRPNRLPDVLRTHSYHLGREPGEDAGDAASRLPKT